MKTAGVVLTSVVVIIGIGIGAWYLGKHSSKQPGETAATNSDAATNNYTDPDGYSFAYPIGWRITNEAASHTVTITPPTSLLGQLVAGGGNDGSLTIKSFDNLAAFQQSSSSPDPTDKSVYTSLADFLTAVQDRSAFAPTDQSKNPYEIDEVTQVTVGKLSGYEYQTIGTSGIDSLGEDHWLITQTGNRILAIDLRDELSLWAGQDIVLQSLASTSK